MLNRHLVIGEPKRLQSSIEVCFVPFQKRNVDVFPVECEIRALRGDLQVHKEEASYFVVAPIAMSELVPNAQAVNDPCEGLDICASKSSGGINRSHQRISSLQSRSSRSDSIDSSDHGVAQGEIGRLGRVVADGDFEFPESGQQATNDSGFGREAMKGGINWHGCDYVSKTPPQRRRCSSSSGS